MSDYSFIIDDEPLAKFMCPHEDNFDYEDECWQAYLNGELIYDKPKTIQNLWIEYGLAAKSGNNLVYTKAYTGKKTSLYKLVEPTDWQNWLLNTSNYIKWQNVKIPADFWGKIKSFYETHRIHPSSLGNFMLNSTTEGTDKTFTIRPDNEWMSGSDMIRNTNLTKFTFKVFDSTHSSATYVSALTNMFRGAGSLTEVIWLEADGSIPTTCHFKANDMSGAFEWCGSLKSFGEDVDWSWKANGGNHFNTTGGSTQIAWMFEWCSSMTEVKRSRLATSREDNCNTIIVSRNMQQFADYCKNLVKIDPIMDMRYVIPNTAANTYMAFVECSKLADIRLKNLNHGDWDFTNWHTNLPALNQESVEYLINNLFDLNTVIPPDANGNEQYDNPLVKTASITCPAAWNSYITNTMISNAGAKGWTIQFKLP